MLNEAVPDLQRLDGFDEILTILGITVIEVDAVLVHPLTELLAAIV